MTEYPRLSDVRRRTVRLMQFQDGTWDLLLGAIFLSLAFYPLTRAAVGPDWNMGIFLAFILLLSAAWMLVRWRIVTPRIGYAKMRRSPALKIILAIEIVLFLLTVGAVILTRLSPGWLGGPSAGSAPSWLQEHVVDLSVLLLLAGLFSALGFVFGVKRLFAYGWIIGGANMAAVMIYNRAPEGFNLPMGMAAGAVLLTGAVLFARFLRAHPVSGSES